LRAIPALASPMRPFTIQDSDFSIASDSTCADTQTTLTTEDETKPEVHLDDGLFVGIRKGNIDKFLGIPFAFPPTGERRLRRPEPTKPYAGLHYVQEYGKSCPQQAINFPDGLSPRLTKDLNSVLNRFLDGLTPSAEDCLTINVVKPSSATSGSNLPVLVYIFGGGFVIGSSSTFLYDGGNVVPRSIDLDQPVVFVSMNYRLSAFGFLPGKEIKDAKVGNLGIQDQRLALKWVQTYIKEFGGDPTKVTIWGESAGAISVSLHMVLNNGNNEGLFRAAVMQSGSPGPFGDIEHGQVFYDFMVKETGCQGASDTLACLRKVPYDTYKRATDAAPGIVGYRGIALPWWPRVDGDFVTENPQYSVLRGHVANVPMITGDCDDEATLFTITLLNITTTEELRGWLKTYLVPNAKESQVTGLLEQYPDDQRAGSPFDTGLRNALTPQFKRIAALQGDWIFQAPRRFFLKNRAHKQNSWGFVSKRFKELPFLGSAHGTDLLNSFGNGGELKDYIIRFANKLDPNGKKGLGVPWPQWNRDKPKAVIFQDDILFPVIVEDDNARSMPKDYISNMSLLYPF